MNYWIYPAVKSKYNKKSNIQTQNILNELTEKVGSYFGVTKEEIKSEARVRTINEPRQIMIYLAYREAGITTTAIANYLNRHHASILNASKKVQNYMQFDLHYRELVNKFI